MAFHDLLFAAQLHAPLDLLYPARPPRDSDGFCVRAGGAAIGTRWLGLVLGKLATGLRGGNAELAGHA